MKRKLAIGMTNITESSIFKRLMSEPESAQEILRQYNIVTRVAPLGSHLAGMVYRSSNSTYYIIANQILELAEQRFVFFHELAHIVLDAPKSTYLLSIEHTHAEKVADQQAATAYQIIAKMQGFF